MSNQKINYPTIQKKEVYIAEPSSKIKILVDALRLASEDKDIKNEKLLIPDDCEKYGFAEGKHNLSLVLHFLADMLEE
jgi:hypothetical protein